MGLESFVPKETDKKSIGLTGKVEHFSRSYEGEGGAASLVENIIVEHDSKKKEELVGSLNTMLNEIGLPETYLEDLDEGQKDQVNMVAAKYLDAVIALDSQAKMRYKKELAQILG